jgi:NAD+ diphosphatase
MTDRHERACGLASFVLPVDGGRMLLAKHTYGYPQFWAMVGGMAEPGEDVESAARREVLEETGLQVTTDALVAVVDRGDLLITVFVGRVVGGVEQRQAAEIAELRWFDAAELGSPDVFDLVRRIGPKLLDDAGRQGLAPSSIAWPDDSRRPGWTTLRG